MKRPNSTADHESDTPSSVPFPPAPPAAPAPRSTSGGAGGFAPPSLSEPDAFQKPRVPSHLARTPRARGVAVSMGCFALAFLLMGGACYLALDWPRAGVQELAVALSTLAAAVAFVGFGTFVLARQGIGRQTSNAKQESKTAPDPIAQRLDALGLTGKEHDVALLILQRRSYNDIASACGIAPRTVQFHASNVFHKAGVPRRRDFERAMREGSLAGGGTGAARRPITPPCAFPECAVCQRKGRMPCLKEPRPSGHGRPRERPHMSPRQPKGNDW